MKLFAIRDESAEVQKDLAYLLYYETEKKFYIELPEDADPWETPMLLSSFAGDGVKTVNAYWSKVWVQQRIVPADRQNLGQILKDNHLKEYDEYALLMLGMGRCAQDDCYLVPMEEEALPAEIRGRFNMRIEDSVPLDEYHMLVFFRDGIVRKCSLKEYFEAHATFAPLLKNEGLFCSVMIQPGGYGLEWDVNMGIPCNELYQMGDRIPLTLADFQSFAVRRVVNVAEAAEILGCTRQNIDYLTRSGYLHPIKSSGKNTLYLKSEVLQRNWQ